jgi:hypothetical protein
VASRKGIPNRIGAAVKSNVIAVFDAIGGRDGMAKWALANKGEFYRLYARIIPTESTTEVTFRDASNLSESELIAIATAGSVGTPAKTEEPDKPNGVH